MREIYRKFISIDEATDWGKKNYSYWLPKCQLGGELRGNYDTRSHEKSDDAHENKWFSFYCGGEWGLAINEKNRYGYTEHAFPEEELVEMQLFMDNRLKKSYVPENIWGYRLLDYRNLCESMNRHHINCGAVIEDKGYMGVGLVKSALENDFSTYDTLLKIMIPKGAKGLYIGLISGRREEQELLFARGSKLKVLFTYRKRRKKIIICKMLKSEEADKIQEK